MTLAKEDLDQIKNHFFEWAYQWANEAQVTIGSSRVDSDMLERMVRVEESLVRQMALIRQTIKEIQLRFAKIEKRFEQIDKRFEQVEKRLELVEMRLVQIDMRFEQVDRRFEQVDRRFEELTRRIDRFMIWSFGTTVGTGAIVLGVLRIWL